MDNTDCTLCAREKRRVRSMEQINTLEPGIVQDNMDLKELEMRYNHLLLHDSDRRIIDDYIACILSRQERMEILIYYVGCNDSQNS